MNAIAGLETSCDRRIEEPEGHGHRRPAKGGDRLVAERHRPGRDLFDPADAFIERWPVDGFGGCRWCATTDRPCSHAEATRPRVDQELTCCTDLLTFSHACQYPRVVRGILPRLPFTRPITALVENEHYSI